MSRTNRTHGRVVMKKNGFSVYKNPAYIVDEDGLCELDPYEIEDSNSKVVYCAQEMWEVQEFMKTVIA